MQRGIALLFFTYHDALAGTPLHIISQRPSLAYLVEQPPISNYPYASRRLVEAEEEGALGDSDLEPSGQSKKHKNEDQRSQEEEPSREAIDRMADKKVSEIEAEIILRRRRQEAPAHEGPPFLRDDTLGSHTDNAEPGLKDKWHEFKKHVANMREKGIMSPESPLYEDRHAAVHTPDPSLDSGRHGDWQIEDRPGQDHPSHHEYQIEDRAPKDGVLDNRNTSHPGGRPQPLPALELAKEEERLRQEAARLRLEEEHLRQEQARVKEEQARMKEEQNRVKEEHAHMKQKQKELLRKKRANPEYDLEKFLPLPETDVDKTSPYPWRRGDVPNNTAEWLARQVYAKDKSKNLHDDNWFDPEAFMNWLAKTLRAWYEWLASIILAPLKILLDLVEG